jgi:peptidoglycan hydrolase-like protein with peptidoglycan-binding domain
MLARVLAALALSPLVGGSIAAADAPSKKTPEKSKPAVARKGTSATSKVKPRVAGSKRKVSTRKTSARAAQSRRQTAPTPERYKEIQEALASKGFLTPEQATGQWSESSVEALKRFQAAQNIESTGRINSLSLIALGLGPKRDASPVGGTTPQHAPAVP